MDRISDADGFSREDAARLLRYSGAARLSLPFAQARRLAALLKEAEELYDVDGVEDQALMQLVRQAPAIADCAAQARSGGGARLPARRGVPRIESVMAALCSNGDGKLTQGRLLDALEALDGVGELTMAELWSAPQALRVALSRSLLDVAARIVKRGRACRAAARWVRWPRVAPGMDAAFIEHALKRAGEEGRADARSRLERAMARRGVSPAQAVAQAQAEGTAQLLRLEGLLSVRRMLDGLNWRNCFEGLSRVERALREDPAGVYGRMDDASRDAVRDQVAAIARRARLSESAVARYALAAAREDGGPGGVCRWLYDDEGRRELLRRMGRGNARLARMTPDPSGKRTVAVICGLAVFMGLGLSICASGGWLSALWAVPLGFGCAESVAARLFGRWVRPARLLKLEMDAVPDDLRTLMVMPVLLSSPERAGDVCAQLEALGCLERDGNIDYLLLGDFADAPSPHMPGDASVLEAAREGIARLNARAERGKYMLLVRPRKLLAADGVWMGRDRKRGALEDLNRLLLAEAGAGNAFLTEDMGPERRYAYVITLDADTVMLPGEARRLIGAMAHPLNRSAGGRGYAVLQPRMEQLPSACASGFAALFAGPGGVNAYPTAVSNLWQDMTGRGIYAGKGIYDIAAFHSRLDGALPEGRVLSHDLIEGALAGAGYLGDVVFYDGYPATLFSFLKRLNRWTRGDWQLLPLLLARGRLSAADRFRMLDNLLRSLRAPALLALFLLSLWTGNGGALLAALLVNYLEPILSLPRCNGRLWRLATAHMAILPALTWCALDACLCTLWRLGVSGRRLMEWVTAADAEAERPNGTIRVPGRVAAILALPGLLVPGWTTAALGLAVLFVIAPRWIGGMEADGPEEEEPLSPRVRGLFMALARDTWRFFEESVPPEGNGLPPDNVQLDPPTGAARRTSPTNIALYLLSCLAANRLGFLGVEEMRRRMAATLSALERMDKWRGHPYNWVDIDSLAALKPRYVSSVDSGNLAAVLLTCAAAVETGEALSGRMRALAEGMDFAALYDASRELFAIGMDADTGRLSDAHYDLIASEARILSYVAMLLGQVPVRHWRRLGRGCVRVAGGVAPLSWSGTMFEFLMPLLFMPAPAHTLLGDGARTAVAAQRRHGARHNRPWGVSESGCSALDAALNYQYRAFGLRALALSGESAEDVVAPYAAALAAMVAPKAAAENLFRMRDMGWSDACGLYEAADYLRADAAGNPSLVMSHMAHHQGMALCALCNALTGFSLRADFMGQPRARALLPLLEERPCPPGAARRGAAVRGYSAPPAAARRLAREADADVCVPETFLLHGDGARVLCTSDGAVHYSRYGLDATRFSGDLQCRADGACVHVTDAGTGADVALGGTGSRVWFEPGLVRVQARLNGLRLTLAVCVSPEDGTLIRTLTLRNAGDRPARCAVADVAPVALSGEGDWRAHAAFQCLFVESLRPAPDALLFRRRPGSRGAGGPVLVHLARGDGKVEWECDYERLIGRTGDPGRAGGIAMEWTGGLGATLNPVSALRVWLELAPGASARVDFMLSLLQRQEDADAWLGRWRGAEQSRRAIRLSGARALAVMDFAGLSASRQHLLQRLAALLLDGRLAAQARGSRPGEDGASREQLWPLGLSGELPLLVMRTFAPGDAGAVRELIRAHGFYRALGLAADLVLVDEGGDGYARPVRDMLENLVDASHLNRLRGVPGGVWVLDGASLDASRRRALYRFASARFDADRDFYIQARGLLSAAEGRRGEAPGPMPAGADTLKPFEALADNGYGGFVPGGYAIRVRPRRVPPAPWCNLLANDRGGIMLSERGGGFAWQGNSRSGRLTAFGNDPLRESWGLMLYLADGRANTLLRLLPGEDPRMPFHVFHGPRTTCYAFDTRRVAGEVRFAMTSQRPEVTMDVRIENRALPGGNTALVGFVDWLLGTDDRDAVCLNCWYEDGACLATGACGGAAYFMAADAGAMPGPGRCAFLGRGTCMWPEGISGPARDGGWTLRVPLGLKRGERRTLRLILGWEKNVAAARQRLRQLRDGNAEQAVEPARFEMKNPDAARLRGGNAEQAIGPARLEIDTPDEALNRLANDFLLHQVRAARVQGRTGFYQPGGAYGFRDQLQDMLALMRVEPERAREHLLRCAARQFEAGDVMHWWHEPFTGVRTRISDDMLFLPWVTAAYVSYTGDTGVLEARAAYLEDVAIPPDREDIYCQMRPSDAVDTLHGHCMRAFRRAAATGPHGLLRMGAGDWNDGMNRVGAQGRGESVWLTQFAIACANRYRSIVPDPADGVWLWRLSEQLRGAVEAHGWDGGWYLRAYDDDGAPLGGAGCAECRIDAISQAWAVLADLDAGRCQKAMDAAWERLVDEKLNLIRLLTPPFEGRGGDVGYIRGYPAGVRENGGQYTHGALWLLLALIRMGDGSRAHRALQMLLPFRHSDTPEKAEIYRLEPYVMAADIYDRPGGAGRGGWSWYTGAAGWMHTCILALLGFERLGDRVRLNALLGEWPRAGVTLSFGGSVYHLACEKNAARVTLDGMAVADEYIRMTDDGKAHEAVFPERKEPVVEGKAQS